MNNRNSAVPPLDRRRRNTLAPQWFFNGNEFPGANPFSATGHIVADQDGVLRKITAAHPPTPGGRWDGTKLVPVDELGNPIHPWSPMRTRNGVVQVYRPSDPLDLPGYLNEPARTNLLLNPLWKGAVAGTPGTPPTNWTFSFNSGSIQSVTPATDAGSDILTFSTSDSRIIACSVRGELRTPCSFQSVS